MSSAPAILGLAGRAGAGKDYVASYLQATYRKVGRVAFADALRKEVADLFGVDPWTKPYPEHVRWLLQGWGVYRRTQNPEYWIDRARESEPDFVADQNPHVADVYDKPDLVVYTDVRFPNEVAAIKHRGGWVAGVSASAPVRAQRLGIDMTAQLAMADHPSEQLDLTEHCDVIIRNEVDGAAPVWGYSLANWFEGIGLAKVSN